MIIHIHANHVRDLEATVESVDGNLPSFHSNDINLSRAITDRATSSPPLFFTIYLTIKPTASGERAVCMDREVLMLSAGVTLLW